MTAGYRQQAAILVSAFDMNKQEAIKRTSSSVSCFMLVYATKKDYGPNTGMYEVGYSYPHLIFQVFSVDEMARPKLELRPKFLWRVGRSATVEGGEHNAARLNIPCS